jgi:gluconate 2-dehydrogenase gamma chain
MDDFLSVDRRELLARAFFLVGAAAMAGTADIAVAASSKRFLKTDAFKLLGAVADTIIPKTDTPGAIEARVPAKFDTMLANWASPERRIELVSALKRIDAVSKEKAGKPFAALATQARHDLLNVHDMAALKQVPETRKLNAMEAMIAGPAVADPGYAKLREIIILLYYYSEEALTSELPYEHSPGGWTPSIKLTPETRNPGGLGLF